MGTEESWSAPDLSRFRAAEVEDSTGLDHLVFLQPISSGSGRAHWMLADPTTPLGARLAKYFRFPLPRLGREPEAELRVDVELVGDEDETTTVHTEEFRTWGEGEARFQAVVRAIGDGTFVPNGREDRFD